MGEAAGDCWVDGAEVRVAGREGHQVMQYVYEREGERES